MKIIFLIDTENFSAQFWVVLKILQVINSPKYVGITENYLCFHRVRKAPRWSRAGYDVSLFKRISESSTGPLDYEATGPVPDPEPRQWGLSRGSGSLWNNYSTSLGIRGCVSVSARICSNSYFTNKNSCWSFTLLRPPSLIICILLSHYSTKYKLIQKV